ncbi:LuxR family transcriptional regulator [Allokutzneria oryzae]|uniref:LuxR family transcriptional regulator n=1 Tax=Allokutzneria oryzae TaxID=1378989 RepID=A0ABV6ACL6_9PSEU
MPAPVNSTDLRSLAGELLARASAEPSGRATHVFRASPRGLLSQVLLALAAERQLSEHENPGEAFLHVLIGRVRLSAGEDEWELGPDGHVVIPQRRHRLVALEDSVALLTIAKVP